MNRRTLRRRRYLRTVGIVGVAGLAGCSSDGGNDDSGATEVNDETAPTTAGTDAVTPTATPPPTTSSATSAEDTETAGSDPMNDWMQQAKLTADDGDDDDDFGRSVAVSRDGTTALIGANSDDDPNGDTAGSAYVFEASGDTWSQQAKLTADDGEELDNFGSSVAMSGDGTTALIGSHRDENRNGVRAGSVYVFENSRGTWSEEAKLTTDDGEQGDVFGRSVAVSRDGTTALIGAYRDNNPNGENAGSAHVFEQSGNTWSEQIKLTADDGNQDDQFGREVAVSGDGTTGIVTALGDNGRNRGGSAYVFEASGDTWSQQAKLTPDNGEQGDLFGRSVTVSRDGTTALIGAASDGSNRGSTYVFKESDGSWSQQARLTANDGDSGDVFGREVAMTGDGTTAIICAPWDEDPADYDWGDKAGSAYLFEASGGTWSQEAKLVADDGHRNDYFGSSVGVSGDGNTALIGAYRDENAFDEETGAVYVFE